MDTEVERISNEIGKLTNLKPSDFEKFSKGLANLKTSSMGSSNSR